MLSDDYEPNVQIEEALRIAFRAMETIMRCIRDIRWRILITTPQFPFITCDNPFFYDDPTVDPRSWYDRHVGLINPNLETIFPISKSMVALGNRNHPTDALAIAPQWVREINLRMFANAQRFVYASCHDLNGFAAELERRLKPVGQTSDDQ